jgi:hypothetical protein
MPKARPAKRRRLKSAGRGVGFLHRLLASPEPRRPLVSLAFLAPALAVYTAGLVWVRPDLASAADLLLRDALSHLRVTGMGAPPLLVVVVLMGWHLVRRDPWRFPPRVLAAMLVETILLLVPLVALRGVFRAIGAAAAALAMGPPAGPVWLEAVMKSIGTGVYEELLFRLALVGGLLLACRAVLGSQGKGAALAAVLIAAALFAGAHTLYAPQTFTWPTFLFRTGAGIYLGYVFARRGFGIAAGVHIAYNLLVKLLSLS